MHNSFIRQWDCSITWGPSQWNLGWNLFEVAYNHPFKAYAPGKFSARIFFFDYLSWLVPRLWPERVWLSKKYTPLWSAILVMDAIQRYFGPNTPFSLLVMSLGRGLLMDLVVIMENPFTLWEWSYWNTKLAIWYLWLQLHRPSSHSQTQ